MFSFYCSMVLHIMPSVYFEISHRKATASFLGFITALPLQREEYFGVVFHCIVALPNSLEFLYLRSGGRTIPKACPSQLYCPMFQGKALKSI